MLKLLGIETLDPLKYACLVLLFPNVGIYYFTHHNRMKTPCFNKSVEGWMDGYSCITLFSALSRVWLMGDDIIILGLTLVVAVASYRVMVVCLMSLGTMSIESRL